MDGLSPRHWSRPSLERQRQRSTASPSSTTKPPWPAAAAACRVVPTTPPAALRLPCPPLARYRRTLVAQLVGAQTAADDGRLPLPPAIEHKNALRRAAGIQPQPCHAELFTCSCTANAASFAFASKHGQARQRLCFAAVAARLRGDALLRLRESFHLLLPETPLQVRTAFCRCLRLTTQPIGRSNLPGNVPVCSPCLLLAENVVESSVLRARPIELQSPVSTSSTRPTTTS